MKLWKKISLLTTSVLLVTTGVTGGIVVHRTVQYNETKTVENYEQQLHATAYALGKEISDSELEGYTEATRSSFYNYILKKYGASKYILIKDGEVVCNLTAFDLVNPREERWAGTEASADFRQVGEQHLLILGKKLPADSLSDYRLVLGQDITELYADMEKQAWLFAEIYFAAAVISVLIIFLITGRLLKPLRKLQQAAADISEGRLGQRAQAGSKDEIGAMAASFNRMADRIEEQVTELEKVSAQRGMLLGSLTHELKTPMTSIIGYSDTLLHVKLSEERREQALHRIHDECRRLERLSGKLMNLIGLYDNDSIRLEETEVEDLFSRVADLEKYHLEECGMTLETRSDGQTRRLDRDLFESLLINLIDNAVKAGKEGDAIRLEAAGNEISVTDQGRGIPPGDLPRVTEAFYMVDKSRSRKAGGIGLGLALCSRIAELHNASLHIESREGEGTRVTVVFQGEA